MFNFFEKRTPEQLNDAAIKLLRDKPTPKRIAGGKSPDTIVAARSLLLKGCRKTPFNSRIHPILEYNYGVCLYHLNVADFGQFRFAVAIDLAASNMSPEEEFRLRLFFCTFFRKVCGNLEGWWNRGFIFEPDWLIESAHSTRPPPVDSDFSRLEVHDFVSGFMHQFRKDAKWQTNAPTFQIRSDHDLL